MVAAGEAMHRSELSRDEIYLITKVEENEDACDATKKNLEEIGTDYSDLVLIHRPPESGSGVELWERLIETHADGLARDVSVSKGDR